MSKKSSNNIKKIVFISVLSFLAIFSYPTFILYHTGDKQNKVLYTNINDFSHEKWIEITQSSKHSLLDRLWFNSYLTKTHFVN